MTDRADLRAYALAAAASVGAALVGAWLGAPAALAGPLAAVAGVALAARLREGKDAPPPAARAPAPPPLAPSAALPAGGGRALLEQLPFGLALVGADGRILFQNEAARDLLERDVAGLHCSAAFRVPALLEAISGFIETLQGHARDDPEATDRFLAIMAQQAQRMKRLVEDLLSLNRIEINEHVQPREPLDLAAVAWEVAGALKPVADVEGAQIVVELPEEGLIVRGDRQEIAQVLVNLIDNAIKYAGQGGPIRIARAPGEGARRGLVGVSVIDSGPGIAREHLPRLTERFYRVSAARSRERGGTGLGLAIAKHVLNRHRGELSIWSAVGKGSRFTIWLPELSGPTRPPV